MENDNVIVAQSPAPKSGNPWPKKILIATFCLIILIAVAGVSYLLGVRRGSPEEISPTPTQEPLALTETPTPTPEDSAHATGGLSPTKKPSLTSSPVPSPTPTIKTKTLSSSASLDGFRSSNGGGNAALEIRAGRNINLVTRGFMSFDLSGMPAAVTLVEARLRLYQVQVIGSPYSVGGSLKLDHLTYGDSLDDVDYSTAALFSSFTTLTSNASLEWKDAVVTDALRDDIANARSHSQFRIHFQTENTGGNATGDFAYFEAADNTSGTGNTPQLVVRYY